VFSPLLVYRLVRKEEWGRLEASAPGVNVIKSRSSSCIVDGRAGVPFVEGWKETRDCWALASSWFPKK
jgi:hypothetical protein